MCFRHLDKRLIDVNEILENVRFAIAFEKLKPLCLESLSEQSEIP